MKNELPFVSIEISVLDGERTVRSCLTSLLHVDYPEERREIIVVDNGSTDRTVEIVKGFPLRLLLETRRGIYHTLVIEVLRQVEGK